MLTRTSPHWGTGLQHPEDVVWDSRREVLFTGGDSGELYEVTLEPAITGARIDLPTGIWIDREPRTTADYSNRLMLRHPQALASFGVVGRGARMSTAVVKFLLQIPARSDSSGSSHRPTRSTRRPGT